MEPIRIAEKSWVVVCDGAKALLLRNEGRGGNIDLTVVETLAQDNEKDRDLGTDRPGRANGADGSSRSAMEETDWHVQAEERFLKDLVGRLSEMAFSKEIEAVVIVAPPRALGTMRPHYSGLLKQAIHAEIAKDLVKHPVGDIEKHLAA